MINTRKIKIKGFTLIELMTSISIFLIIMTISMGAILSIFTANDKVGNLKTSMDNLNLAVETMSREIRFGSRYHCGTGVLSVPENCTGGTLQLSFLSNNGEQIVYKPGTNPDGTNNILKSVDGGATFVAVTAPEISIQNFIFYVTGATKTNPEYQPRLVIIIKGQVGAKASSQTSFNIQTEVSQRLLDGMI